MANSYRCLVVDDETDIRELVVLTLERMGIQAESASSVTDAKHMLGSFSYDLCLTDMRLPDGLGLELVQHINAQFPGLPVAVITAYGSAENAVSALKAGAYDYITKPISLKQLRPLVESALKLSSQKESQGANTVDLIGASPAMGYVRTMIAKLARSQAPVYISGESGSGKELAARLIHLNSSRKDQSFIAVNCGAIPENLMESEFFGYKKGAFTGAIQDTLGLFQAANGGTLFLDEVADLPLAMQVKLLRAIQEKKVRVVGNTSEEAVDVRIISATHKNLNAMMEKGEFRQDLYYRLNVIQLKMPALRERPEDIPELTERLLGKLCLMQGISIPSIADEAKVYIQQLPFHGNVRELENMLERALALCDGATITVEDLSLEEMPASLSDKPVLPWNAPSLEQPSQPIPAILAATPPRESQPMAQATPGGTMLPMDISLSDYLEDIEKRTILQALEKTNNNKTAAAKLLGISFRTLRYRLSKLGLSKEQDADLDDTEGDDE
ncbi:sigma-54 dependent transcriptional regulator [Methylophilus sp.]|jgi:two-component system, NtrC family, response regulator PilR|uniref:sigma-54-dependent transcriptional regulator n=1 Tax=Methylophilus sp. TaxID=29541 RepID=UPI0011D5FE60|nr:sigma-54 dependent transcriptional regulator [Methylophilus sp.]TXI43338.1 MAG: sigma-54-dependent Fis family transcriptional regulator [Methylophilus sp.]